MVATPMTTDPNIGRLISNRYQLVELIGTGAMGKVYRAEDKILGDATVAVKFLSQTLLNPKMRERFVREATISAHLAEKTIHIVKVGDCGVDENQVPFYVMEFLQGDCLSDIIQDQALSVPRFINISRQICLGLEGAHRGITYKGQNAPIIHRDIKPSNIFILQDPTLGELVKILDFGIAKLIQSGASMTHSFMGTLAYCSPEQMEGKELDNRSDIYSLGVMMYEMLTNEMPLLPETASFAAWYKAHHEAEPKSFDSLYNIPVDLQKLIKRCMAKSPDDRPQTMGEILAALEKIEGHNHYKSRFGGQQKFYSDTDKTLVSSPDEVFLQTSWPKDKPLQKIVFPRLMHTPHGTSATLWVMLEQEDILNRAASIRYNQFLFLSSPHPMILWITVLYNQKFGPRWLPCYLDLKTDNGQEVASLLAESGEYRLLFFALEQPTKCRHLMTANIDPNQRKLLLDWTHTGQMNSSAGQPQISKRFLKQEFEKLKPKILAKLQSSAKTK